MAIDIMRVTEVLKEAILRELGDEVDLIFRYGSQLKGTTHKYSDIDISYTPVHETTWNNITVVVEDIMIDFYPIHWSQLEQMANFDNISCTCFLRTMLCISARRKSGNVFVHCPRDYMRYRNRRSAQICLGRRRKSSRKLAINTTCYSNKRKVVICYLVCNLHSTSSKL